MNNKKAWRNLTAIRGAVLLALWGASAAASADQFGMQVAAGIADHDVKKADLGFVWDPKLTWWYIGGFHFTVVGEAHVAYWHAGDNAIHSNIFEVGAQPMFRIIKDSGAIRPYFEAGAGVRALSHPTVSSDYTLSSAFQFTEVVGVGAQFGGRQQYQAGFRFQHISNADIKRPNPGINFSQLYLQYNF
jgi:lipid A 3-O-deacylase